MTQPNKTALRQIEAVSTAGQTLPLFDWSELADPDEHPTLAIISPMGGGKSRLAKFLARYVLFPGQSPELRAIDIYGRLKDWQDATLVTDYGVMVEMMANDLDLIGDRVKAYRTGQDNFTPLFWVFEEAPDTIRTLRKSRKDSDALVTAWVTKTTTVARKVKARLCLVSVRLSGSEIGVSAEARNDATVIFPGRKGVAKAMGDDRIFKLGAKQNKELREQLSATLASVKRPALVYTDGKWYPASIPELDATGNVIGAMTPVRSLPASPAPLPPPQPRDMRASLEALYYSEEFDIEPRQDDDSELYNTDGSLLRIPAVILEYAQQNPDGVTARMCARNKNALKVISCEEIERIFKLLHEARLGVVGAVGGVALFLVKPDTDT